MSERQFYYTPDGTEILGPVSGDWLWESFYSGQLADDVHVCEAGTQEWLAFKVLPNSAFSARILAEAARRHSETAEARELHVKAQERLARCQAHMSQHWRRTPEIEQAARFGLEFVDAALRLVPNEPNFLNTKAMLQADGLGEIKLGLTTLNYAAKVAPTDMQIKMSIRELKRALSLPARLRRLVGYYLG